MPVHSALQFIVLLREDEALRARLEALGPAAPLERVVELGASAGLAFSIDDLRAAHRYDWAMRWARYGAAAGSKADG